ncbi:CocE/NonD family hydrolase [Variovorax sp. DAIF25]|uniref:CocE/NonD family hydrolase n=1 Tax=Variovorax sp. DAIF25 TaxID=3080983 RepID=UPI003D6A7D2C
MHSETRDGMRIDWDAPIEMSDGLVLRADVFRPVGEGRYPVLISYGPYGKGLAFQEGYSTAWTIMAAQKPEVLEGSSNKYQQWEVCDPEKWVPHGYVCIRVDSRGAGRSPGVLDCHSLRETEDFRECIEWAGEQPWSSGKVGLSGISYYAMNQWRVAALRPRHLAALMIWEGAVDRYREASRHGGIACSFSKNWLEMQVKPLQHGRGERGARSAVTGELVCGPETVPDEELAKLRVDAWPSLINRPLDDDNYRDRSGLPERIEVPLLSAANWGGQGLHLRGNIEGFLAAGSQRKWLEVHGGTHWVEYYTDYGIGLQRRFFDHFLKGIDNGWDREPPVLLNVRRVDGFVQRAEHEWPLARTRWTRLYLHAEGMALRPEPPTAAATLDYDTMGEGLSFRSAPMAEETEITGPSALRLRLSSRTRDADLFAVLRVFDPAGKELLFYGALDPKTPVGQGWLRASHRKLDAARSTPWRPYHTHDELQPLAPGEPVDLDVEIWPTSVVVPKGWSVALTLLGRDYEHGQDSAALSNMKNPMRGCGPFVHDDADDRPPAVFDTVCTLHLDPADPAWLLLPVVPEAAKEVG